VNDSFHRSWSANEQNIRAVTEARQLADQHNNSDWIVILNVNQFVSLCNYDFSHLHYDLCTLETGWKRSLQARLAALLIVEYMEDIGELTGKKFGYGLDCVYC